MVPVHVLQKIQMTKAQMTKDWFMDEWKAFKNFFTPFDFVFVGLLKSIIITIDI